MFEVDVARGASGLRTGAMALVLALAGVVGSACGDAEPPLGDSTTPPSSPSDASVAAVDAGSPDASSEPEPVADSSVDPGADAGVTADAEPASGPLAFVFAGESNSGGIALNSAATEAELAPRPAVQIMNLYSGTFAFEPLDIGFNNIVDHAGLSDQPAYVPIPPNTILIHGMELGLANAVEAGAFEGQSSVYLIKTGQGGSRISQWAEGGGFWSKFLERTNAAKAVLPTNTRWVVWYSQGINDAIAGVLPEAWKAETTAHFQKIKAQLPGCRIVLTEFQSMPGGGGFPVYNAAIRELVAADPSLASVATDNAGNDGAYHWSYAGYRDVVVPALVEKSIP